VQEAASPAALADALLPLLDGSSAERATMTAGLGRIPGRLGGPGASRRVAELAAGLIEAKRRG
jgi:lipid-A-disaccharide synthase